LVHPLSDPASLALILAGQPLRADDREAGFVLANTIFTMHHEIAHMLIAELHLPAVGREEDAADQYAWLRMLSMRPVGFHDQALRDVLEGWRLESLVARKLDESVEPSSNHSTHLQRHFMGACLIVGSDLKHFRRLAMDLGLPEEQWRYCAEEHYEVHWSWNTLMSLENPVEYGEFGLLFQDPASGHEDYRRMVQRSPYISAAVRAIQGRYVLHRDIRLRFASCGQAEASWDFETGELLICYEEMERYRDLYHASR